MSDREARGPRPELEAKIDSYRRDLASFGVTVLGAWRLPSSISPQLRLRLGSMTFTLGIDGGEYQMGCGLTIERIETIDDIGFVTNQPADTVTVVPTLETWFRLWGGLSEERAGELVPLLNAILADVADEYWRVAVGPVTQIDIVLQKCFELDLPPPD